MLPVRALSVPALFQRDTWLLQLLPSPRCVYTHLLTHAAWSSNQSPIKLRKTINATYSEAMKTWEARAVTVIYCEIHRCDPVDFNGGSVMVAWSAPGVPDAAAAGLWRVRTSPAGKAHAPLAFSTPSAITVGKGTPVSSLAQVGVALKNGAAFSYRFHCTDPPPFVKNRQQ